MNKPHEKSAEIFIVRYIINKRSPVLSSEGRLLLARRIVFAQIIGACGRIADVTGRL